MKKTALLLCVFAFAASAIFTGCQKTNEATLNLSAIFPLSGQVAFYGNETLDGIKLAVEEINAAGGLLGKKVNLLIEDDENNTSLAVSAFLRLATQNKVSVVMGSSTSGATMAIAPLAQQQGVVLISPSATNISVTEVGNFVFRACFIDPFQGVVGADFAFDHLNARRAAVLYDAGADYNTGLALAFIERFQERGGTIVARESYQSNDVDFNAQAVRIRASNADFVYLPNYYNDVALQALQLRAQGVNAALMGGDGWDSLIDEAGPEVIGGFWSAAFSSDTTDPRGAAFVQAFEARFGRTASQFAALGYDTMMIVAQAIRAAGSDNAVAIRDAMAQVDSAFVSGNIRFDENRNPIKGAAILEIQDRDGKLVNVYRATVNP
ncbi:MAG: ABC transporter substrate-binding protein [Treponema sp.]|nr:ABC transporter substrate-binding protein [Treponema sp.]